MTETKVRYRKDGQPDKRKLNKGNPYGKAPMSDVAQDETFQFRCTPGSREVFKLYGQGLKLDQTELFYRMVWHVGSLGTFINWFKDKMPEQIEKNPEWFASLEMVSKCCQTLLVMNKGRIKQVEENPISAKIVKDVSDVLEKHFDKKSS